MKTILVLAVYAVLFTLLVFALTSFVDINSTSYAPALLAIAGVIAIYFFGKWLIAFLADKLF